MSAEGPASKSHTPHPITNWDGSYNEPEAAPDKDPADDPLETH